MGIITEVVVYTIESAQQAQKGGADRIELCANPGGGGTTPSAGTIQAVCNLLSIPVFVMIRPREGNFCYSTHEFEAMKADVLAAKIQGADGMVLGILSPDGHLDTQRCQTLIELAHPLPVTLHRAFDMSRNPHQTLQDAINCGFRRLLTSGQQPSALQGLPLITNLIGEAENRITIMPGCGINEETVAKIVATSGAREIHVSASMQRPSQMDYRNTAIRGMGSTKGEAYTLQMVDAERLRTVKSLAQKHAAF